eukprot:TRINITY_DN12406_c0_g1_i1.p1 TRINITY_DN12406_c0_g1~~TRINITY_DN12406_c0_g1_i1.p1  ORF type:complete len:293 (-),score=65.52 TRINITY_DN12406_c0_g1_i1:108-986(-)
MSRHSKNNTANSVFTYGERQKLKDYGTQKQRLGKESMKAFDRCSLCLHPVREPYCCGKGHIFCKDCLLENLYEQKKRVEEEVKAWELRQQRLNLEAAKKEEEKRQKQIEQFDKLELSVARVEAVSLPTRVPESEEEERARIIKQLKETAGGNVHLNREDKVKQSFWIPETTPDHAKKAEDKPSKKLTCPGSKPHEIKLKEVIKCQLARVGDVFLCHSCKDELAHQKISVIRRCGHVLCTKCVVSFCKTNETCLVCSGRFNFNLDVINLEESGSAFASHNAVEAVKYSSAFAI